MFNILKKIFSKFLDYVAYVILGLFGLGIFNILYIVWFTHAGRILISMTVFVIIITWASIRAFRTIG